MKKELKTNEKLSTENETPPIANVLLAAGFRSNREAKRFSKMYALMMLYQKGQVVCNINIYASMIASEMIKDYAYKELLKMGVPNGFQMLGSFDEALRWFFKACR